MRSKRHVGQLALVLLPIVLLAGSAYALTTEDLDIIWAIPGDTAAEAFGVSLASGDVNGDGIPDIMAASYLYCEESLPRPDRGRIDVFYGSHVGDSAPDFTLWSRWWSGADVPQLACADLNGDGYADIVAAEDMADSGYGACTVWLGGDPVDTVPDYFIRSRSIWWLNGGFGRDVSVGDVDGDGCDDAVVGAYRAAEEPGHQGAGRVYVFSGGPSFDSIPDVILRGEHDGESEGFGIGVSAEGDFDHDGFHDLLIGAWQYGGFGGKGRVYVYCGGNPMDTSYDMAMSGESPAQCLGFDKPGALNSQGSFDYAVEGNELWPHGIFNPSANCGKVYVWQGGRPMDSIPDVELIGRMDTAELGRSAQASGDVTGDGNDDLVGGAPWTPPDGSGGAYLWETGDHFDTVPDAWMTGEPRRLVGMRVCTAGDIDGDGRSEFLVSNYLCEPRQHVWVCKYTGVGVQEEEGVGVNARPLRVWPSVVNRQLNLAGWNEAVLLDASGRKVRDLKEGANSVRGLAPGVYFVREAQAQAEAQDVRKVVVTK
jgi:hypothetical protein